MSGFDLRLALRPRTPLEATDLGVRLAQHHAAGLARHYLPLAGAVACLAWACASLGEAAPALLVWLLKPWLGRGVLLYYAQAVFGQPVGGRQLWSAQGWGGASFAMSWLTLRRLSFWRSFTAPIGQLEQLSGRAYWRRRRLLLKGQSTTAARNQSLWVHVELVLILGLLALGQWMSPFVAAGAHDGEGPFALGRTFMQWVNWVYVPVALLVEPLNVASGLCLYLNRRAELESWDVEQAVRSAFDAR